MRGFYFKRSFSNFHKHRLSLLAVAAIAPLCLHSPEANAKNAKPSLLVMITVDGLRGDMLPRFKERFGKGGFRYLMDKGAHYTKAHYQQSNTITAVGHATLFTGGHPSQHGIASNDWFDRKTGKRMYCVGDDSVTMIGSDKAGSSPRNLKSSTIGDQIVLASGQKSRVFSVSIKDRGAVLPAGFKGKAFWYSKNTGDFVSSTYYYKDYPKWVSDFNAAKPADKFKEKPWNLMYDKASYVYGDADVRPGEKSYGELGSTFPHSMKTTKPATYYKSLRMVPYGDMLTVDFAKEILKQEKLGKGTTTDMLAVSLSVNDYIAHYFGPGSLEAEDNLLHLDKTLAGFFSYIDKTVGLDNTLIVLASDHGTDDVPEHKHHLGFPAGRHDVKTMTDALNKGLQARFNTTEEFINVFIEPNMYLKKETITKLGLDPVVVETALAEELLKIEGISMAFTRNDLATGQIPNNTLTAKVQRAFYPERSGDVYIIQDQFWYLSEWGDELAASHGTPYPYDTHVPVLFAGPGVNAQTINRPIAPVDVVATLAVYFGTNVTTGSIGSPLDEILEERSQVASQ